MPAKHLSLAVRLALTALLVGAGAPAHAVGTLADLSVIERDTGRSLPVHRHAGRLYVAGTPGTRYAIALRNQTGARVLTVVSVDGVNVVSGETAAWGQTGYVLDAGLAFEIAGWRKSDREVAAFEFTALGDSYAARTGRPAHVGVIGLAVFRERPAPVRLSAEPRAQAGRDAGGPRADSRAESREESRLESRDAPPASANSAGAAASKAQAETSSPASAPAPMPAPRLGTGHGARETSVVGRTSFERLRDRPDETVTIYYDSRENLITMGVIPSPAHARVPPPRPFPDSPGAGFVADPPAN